MVPKSSPKMSKIPACARDGSITAIASAKVVGASHCLRLLLRVDSLPDWYGTPFSKDSSWIWFSVLSITLLPPELLPITPLEAEPTPPIRADTAQPAPHRLQSAECPRVWQATTCDRFARVHTSW